MGEGDDVLCECVHVTRADVAAAIRAGARDLEGVVRATGATTGCGTCAGRLSRAVLRLRWAERLGRLTRRAGRSP